MKHALFVSFDYGSCRLDVSDDLVLKVVDPDVCLITSKWMRADGILPCSMGARGRFR